MSIVKSILNFVFNAFVAIGDGVLFVATSPAKLSKKILTKIQHPRTNNHKLSGEFELPKVESQQEALLEVIPEILPQHSPTTQGISEEDGDDNLWRGLFQVIKKSPRIIAAGSVVLFRLVSLIVFAVGRFLRSIFLLPVEPFFWYSAHRSKHKAKKMKEQKKFARFKHGGLRPSIFYKLKYVFVGFMLASIFIFIPLAAFIFVSDLPSLADLSVNYVSKTTKIYDRNDNLLYEIYANQNRTVVKLSDIPQNLRNATVAIEDKDFYSHPGFDLRGMARAFVTNVRNQGFQGGSTITQQLIKSVLLTSDPTIVRKVKEIALAFFAERRYSKNQILELYLNYVPYGGTAWGIQSAADTYFGKKVQDLDLAQSAMLAGLPQSPSTYSPYFGNGSLWKQRQKEVLDAMVKQNYISKNDEDNAYAEQLTFKNEQIPLRAPHFVMYVRNLLVQKYGISEVERGGLNVKTTLDLATQQQAEQIVADEVDSDAPLNIGNGAALITSPSSGDILAMVGSRNYFDQNYDGNVNLTTSLRQPGSSIKLITYSLALSQGYTEATILDDTPLTIAGEDGNPSYTPVNYDGKFHGRVPLRTAFANSFNIPPVRITQKFGATAVKDFGQKMGISSWNGLQDYGVSITLGAADVTMTDLATAYGDIANGGNRVDLDPLLEVKNSAGTVIYKKDPKPTPVVDPGVAFIISDILADNNARSIEFGLNTPLHIEGARVSVKTGTTDNKRDNWTIGFTPKVLVATWVGNNDNTPMNQALASGITGAAPMWNKLMTMMLAKTGTPSAAIVPADIVKKYCLGQDRYFLQGTENSVSCSSAPSGSPSPVPTQ